MDDLSLPQRNGLEFDTVSVKERKISTNLSDGEIISDEEPPKKLRKFDYGILNPFKISSSDAKVDGTNPSLKNTSNYSTSKLYFKRFRQQTECSSDNESEYSTDTESDSSTEIQNKDNGHSNYNAAPIITDFGSATYSFCRHKIPPDNFRDIPVIPRTNVDLLPDEEPFVRANNTDMPYDNDEHYLDVQFRLMREDYIRPLRDGICKLNGGCRRSDSEVKYYTGVQFAYIKPTMKGLLYRVKFSTEHLKNVSWTNTKRLISGNLLCLSKTVDKFEKDLVFAVVVDRNPKDLVEGLLWIKILYENESKNPYNIPVNPFFLRNSQTTTTVRIKDNIDYNAIYTMVESEAFFEAYTHVLSALRETETVPLDRYIVQCSKHVKRPKYMNKSTSYRIKTYCTNSSDEDKTEVPHKWKTVRLLKDSEWPDASKLNLNQVQADALKLALTKEFAVIQGPPGTGKTYVGVRIMEILLANAKQWRRHESHSPILIVCYTNHALDQFVESIEEYCENIIRIGGRCNSDVVAKYTLASIKKEMKTKKKSRFENSIVSSIGALKYGESIFQESTFQIEVSLLGVLKVDQLKEFIPDVLYTQLSGDTEDSSLLRWLGMPNHMIRRLQDLKRSSSKQKDQRSPAHAHIMEESSIIEDRRNLEYGEFHGRQSEKKKDDEYIDKLKSRYLSVDTGILRKMLHKAQSHDRRDLQKIQRQLDKTSTMNDYEVANVHDLHVLELEERWCLYRNWVEKWRASKRINRDNILAENTHSRDDLTKHREDEDEEIVKSRDVIALTTTGAAKYRSLINRLPIKIVIVEEAAEVLEAHIVAALPKTTQHLILIGDHKQLKPSPAVYELAKKYKLEISLFERMIKNVPHVTLSTQHRMQPLIADLLRPQIYSDLQDHSSVSKRNGWENMRGLTKSVFFVSHNIPEENMLEGKNDSCKDVKVTPVDGYQGEENDIILLSLVRSNSEGNIGFLRIENRICVALSRAKNAFYCIGDIELLKEKSTLWKHIALKLEQSGCIGECLVLKCQKHPEHCTPVKNAEDFDNVPEGGCMDLCNARLPCGHSCKTKYCHPGNHDNVKCYERCTRSCERKHPCTQRCQEDCGPCRVLIPKKVPNCGHVQHVECHLPPEEIICKHKIKIKLLCGHEPFIPCYKEKIMGIRRCPVPCDRLLKCGHVCGGTCGRCLQGRLHLPCMKRQKRRLWCGHSTESKCGTEFFVCKEDCKLRCSHSRCERECWYLCSPCAQQCQWQCPHYKCTKLCGEPCDRPRCNEPCIKRLRCKHKCCGVCGEACPDVCSICDGKKFLEIIAESGGNVNSQLIQLEDCDHIFSCEVLDTWMDFPEVGSELKHKICPKCSKPILRNSRYGNIIKKIASDMGMVKQEMSKFNELSLNRKRELHYMFEMKLNIVGSMVEEGFLAADDYWYICKFNENIFEHSYSEIRVYERRIHNLEIVANILGSLPENLSVPGKLITVLKDLRENIKDLTNWLMLPRGMWTYSEYEDFIRDTSRIRHCGCFLEICDEIHEGYRSRPESFRKAIAEVKKLLLGDSSGSYKLYDKDVVEDILVKDLLPNVEGVSLTTCEEKEIFCQRQAPNIFERRIRCHNGHIYCVSAGNCTHCMDLSM
uniref:NFX1-type zinc finger-containing protein 1-like isoform X2 n=1 Tax=Styela clava TaxID=7725 RepID=UPI001939F905|nr:NFX1-type zinc finger-containing protein 1-like isoform X2 [Styela clava]